MSSVKRKMPPTAAGGGGGSRGSSTLQRRVKPRLSQPESDISDLEDDDEDDDDDAAPSEQGFGSEDEEVASDENLSEQEASESDEEEVDPAQLSFGALAKAQASLGSSLGRRNKKKPSTTSEHSGSGSEESEEEDEDTRHRAEMSASTGKSRLDTKKRTSKHAPVEMTSKKQVSRRRDFLTEETTTKFLGSKKTQARDPRFMPATHSESKIDEIKAKKAYAFLDEYRESEMQDLKQAIKKCKNPYEKEKLQKELLVMESKKKAQERKERAEKVIEEHRRQEKELVKQGKTPFYLKKSEQKKRVLEKQFAGLKKGQVDKAIERRRKKVAGKEKKLLPFARRGAEDRH
ncbi:hypothetical protein QBC35DRAFT_486992 [Podospora australis]|uniref:rRNA biogenesis protein RRP36 n=1 Tax=Podospora australis TaxID=1536484 RepID=A0AAN6X166_9PEZI|nr:hypothetical protein QBC35DRAFT_486992 [Podospora australis]